MKREHAEGLFTLAGFEVTRLHELVNQYWNENETRGAWWLAETKYGTIQIGWRKNVMLIDWEGTKLRKILTISTIDNMTKQTTFMHVESYVRALEYLISLNYELTQLN